MSWDTNSAPMTEKQRRASRGEKALHPIAFWVLLISVGIGLGYAIYSMVIAVMALALVEGVSNLAMFAAPADAAGIVATMFRVINGIVLFAFAIALLIHVLFIIALLRNRKSPRPQNYLTLLLIISVIIVISSVASIAMGGWVSMTSLILYGVIIGGIVLQKMYKPDVQQQVS